MNRDAAHAAIVDILSDEIGDVDRAQWFADDILATIWPVESRCTCPRDPDDEDDPGDPISTCPIHGWSEVVLRETGQWEQLRQAAQMTYVPESLTPPP